MPWVGISKNKTNCSFLDKNIMKEETPTSKKRSRVAKSIIGYTNEPKPISSSKIELITLLNYYANSFDFEKSKEYLLKNPAFKDFSDVDAQYFKNYGFLQRILNNGFDDKDGLIKSWLEKAKTDLSNIKSRNQKQKQIKQDNRKLWRIKKDQEIREIGSLPDQLIDNIHKNRNLGFESIRDEFYSINTKEGIQSVQDAACRILKRVESEILEKDSNQQYKRGFLNKCRGQMLLLIEKCQEKLKSQKTEQIPIKRKRAPKKQKPVNKLKKVSKVKFLHHHDVLGDSRGAVTLIGAHEYFVYDGKNLRYYISETDKKLDVTGTSIINFDIDKSCMKVVRKIDYIKDIMGLSKSAKKKLFDGIKAIKKPVTGRLNDECFLIYV